uniref:Uncharacterized protein n=1 Tax=Ciona intestinalis TaxID=7719 RepID=H2XXU2_CIOIN
MRIYSSGSCNIPSLQLLHPSSHQMKHKRRRFQNLRLDLRKDSIIVNLLLSLTPSPHYPPVKIPAHKVSYPLSMVHKKAEPPQSPSLPLCMTGMFHLNLHYGTKHTTPSMIRTSQHFSLTTVPLLLFLKKKQWKLYGKFLQSLLLQ